MGKRTFLAATELYSFSNAFIKDNTSNHGLDIDNKITRQVRQIC